MQKRKTRQKYRNDDGEIVPSVTQIIANLGWSRDALMHWSWKIGFSQRNYRDERNKAAERGTLMHEYIRAMLLHEWIELDSEDPEALSLAVTALEWLRPRVGRIIAVEKPIICKEFAGTPDLIAEIDGRIAIVDWKSGGTWPEHVIQVAAYQALYNTDEATALADVAPVAHLVSVAHDGVDVKTFSLDDLADARSVFHRLCELHRRKKDIAALLKDDTAEEWSDDDEQNEIVW